MKRRYNSIYIKGECRAMLKFNSCPRLMIYSIMMPSASRSNNYDNHILHQVFSFPIQCLAQAGLNWVLNEIRTNTQLQQSIKVLPNNINLDNDEVPKRHLENPERRMDSNLLRRRKLQSWQRSHMELVVWTTSLPKLLTVTWCCIWTKLWPETWTLRAGK